MTLLAQSTTSDATPRHGLVLHYRRLVNALFAIFVFTGMISAMKPSPYDFLSLLVMPLWFLGGFKIHRSAIFILVLWCIFEIAGFAALMPYWDEVNPRTYQFQSFYLFVTVVFFTLFFAERTIERTELCLKAYTFGAVLSGLLGIMSYFDIAGIGTLWSRDQGRTAGTFDDPNLFGSYLTLSAVYLLQLLLLGTTKRVVITTISYLILVIAIFLSYSRGSWAALIGASLVMGISAYLTVQSRHTRRRIAFMSAVAVGIGVLAVFALLARPETRNFFLQRATIAKDYDEGVTGRFGNQIRSIPMLLDRPEGFGPLRFRNFFHLEPHNSYVGAFANDGWIGGFAWIIIVVSSWFVGFRLMLVRSPYQRLAQIFFPTLLAWLLQGFQIDIDHWRQLFLCFGAVWGIEAARLRWIEQQRRRERITTMQIKDEICPAGHMH